jgi:thiol-disulfide isomerase/thioredoxin
MKKTQRAVAAALITCALLLDASAAEKKAEKSPALAVGSVPEDLLGKDVAGKTIRVSDYQGKVVIVSFWASWCGPCRKELPVLASVVKQVGPDQLKVVAINYRDEQKPFRMVVDVLKDYPITILRDQNGKAARKFEVSGIPRMIVIGRDGKVAADHTGYGEDALPGLIKELNQLLAQRT